ncbi:MAG: hypothetical protein OCD76_03350 [Reichenbachiella sp.]
MDIQNFNVVEILNTGVTGFAFLMLFLAYKHATNVQNQILKRSPEDFSSVEMFREWKDLFRTQLYNIRFFMIVALIFFGGGVFILVYKGENKVQLVVEPSLKSHPALVRHQGSALKLNSTGEAQIMVSDNNNITISFDGLYDALKASDKNLANAIAAESQEIGF